MEKFLERSKLLKLTIKENVNGPITNIEIKFKIYPQRKAQG